MGPATSSDSRPTTSRRLPASSPWPAPVVLGNDVILLGTSSAVWNSGPSHGTLTLRSNGSFTYTPTAGYVGQDVFRYHVHDGLLNTLPTTVVITMTNAVPVANDDGY